VAFILYPLLLFSQYGSLLDGFEYYRRRELSFEVGDFVYLKVSPMRGLSRLKIIEKRGEVAYQLELPPQLSDVHDVFHVSQLKKCLRVPKE
jgi:hypothetical protein